MMTDLTAFLAQKRRWHSFNERDLSLAADSIILAMDGNIARADALMCARAAFESMGMEKGRGQYIATPVLLTAQEKAR